MRDLTGGLITEFTSGAFRPIYLYEALFDSGPLRLWTGIGDLSWNGHVWTGSGAILQFSPIRETAGTRADQVTFTLSGEITALVAVALAEPYQGRPASMYVGVMDAARQIVPDPYEAFQGFMDVMEINDGATEARISVTVENMLISLERPSERRYTDEDQRSEFPDDKGFELVTKLQDAEIIWNQTQ